MAESIAGTWASLAGIEIVNDARTFAYLQNGLGPSSLSVYGNCGCGNIYDLLDCHPALVELDQWIDLPGISGNYISTPDSAAVSITGDIDIRAKVALDDWTPAAQQTFVSKYNGTGNIRSYWFYLTSSGTLVMQWSVDGIAAISKSSTATVAALADGSTKWVRATLDVDNGAAGNDVKFYTSDDGSTWTQLGSTVTTAGVTSIFDSTAVAVVGANSEGGSDRLAGKVYYAEIRNGINGPVVAVFDANAVPAQSAQSPNTVPSITGETWTINGAAWAWGGDYPYPYYPYVAPDAYTNPTIDDAPWYTSDIPASAGFLGFVVDEFEGLDSPFTRSVQQAVGNGGILSRSRLKTRELHWRGFLFGASCCSVQYGLRWLTQTLSRFGTGCKDCFGDDLELLICCPDEGEASTGTNSPFRTLKGVGLLEGPTIVSERKTCTSGCSNGCGGSCILEVEFTLVATQPYFYSPEIPVLDCVNLYAGAVSPYTDVDVPCPPFDCQLAVECSNAIVPPTATYVNSCIDPFIAPLANYYTVPRSAWNEFDEVVPIISITTGVYALGHLQLGFYSSTSDNPCGDLVNDPPDCDIICDSLDIIAIPAFSTFYIDGRTRKMATICNDGTAWAGEKLTAGPWSWPTFNCLGFCLEVKFEGSGTVNPGERAACVSISLVPRSF